MLILCSLQINDCTVKVFEVDAIPWIEGVTSIASYIFCNQSNQCNRRKCFLRPRISTGYKVTKVTTFFSTFAKVRKQGQHVLYRD